MPDRHVATAAPVAKAAEGKESQGDAHSRVSNFQYGLGALAVLPSVPDLDSRMQAPSTARSGLQAHSPPRLQPRLDLGLHCLGQVLLPSQPACPLRPAGAPSSAPPGPSWTPSAPE